LLLLLNSIALIHSPLQLRYIPCISDYVLDSLIVLMRMLIDAGIDDRGCRIESQAEEQMMMRMGRHCNWLRLL